ncbi:YqhR family membrane protein [Tepidibacillus fermentans]|uniref:Membrane protein YqhR n=1 Tax=Tepidibacillus fermentans TaxID=1281767 RepID=A0A4R3KL05_9BACI|nr:YqhR family membrane protein [Tepidibacillus fermentans]TCS84016.1 membrane protein YqhR [Tepidibacillus fermentans]
MKYKQKKRKLAIQIGLAAGVIWGFLSLAAYYLQFTDVGPSIYAKPILNPDYVMTWQGHFIGLGFFIVFMILASLLYAQFFAKYASPWVGIGYGLFLWGLLFFVLNPFFHLTKQVQKLGLNTNSVMLSLYILIGLFIGYSISAEFNNQEQEQEQSQGDQQS